MAGCSEKIGGPNKIVEVDESKFGRRKYHRGHPVKGLWVFGGVERDSGRTFLVPVPDRTADTLVAIIHDWVEPGTTVTSDSWAAYRNLESQGFTHRTVNHSIHFVHPDTGAHTNNRVHVARSQVLPRAVQQWGRLRVPLAQYMFMARWKAQGVSPFVQFLHLVANTDLTLCNVPSTSDRDTWSHDLASPASG